MRKLLSLFAVLLLVASVAPVASAQIPTFSAAVGVVAPLSDLKTSFNPGYTVGGAIDLGLIGLPVSARAEVGYSRFSAQSSAPFTGNTSNVAGVLNAVVGLGLPLLPVKPYLIGGVGMYHLTSDLTDVATGTQSSGSSNKVGYNGGAGVDLGIGSLGARVEARYVRVSQDVGNYSYVPVTVSLHF